MEMFRYTQHYCVIYTTIKYTYFSSLDKTMYARFVRINTRNLFLLNMAYVLVSALMMANSMPKYVRGIDLFDFLISETFQGRNNFRIHCSSCSFVPPFTAQCTNKQMNWQELYFSLEIYVRPIPLPNMA